MNTEGRIDRLLRKLEANLTPAIVLYAEGVKFDYIKSGDTLTKLAQLIKVTISDSF